MNFLFRMPEPKFKPKPVVFIIPTSNKSGSSACRMALVCENTLKILGAAGADYLPLAEFALDKLPRRQRL